ncbi:hypothetical protein COCMIDRAFT_108909 [Bipolaris oryzae ATCC 44560]|uniref:F-box domain-containing protein n=1 Tax=Bipolaris oryzae ATCC 44560 TaxID=930090 RepID=W6Z9N0_COCMI|nr:uncharacterized protein COCMIDRAFT_108909 [Bipolaris oryzae ATCC 44560]EUC40411.1 hypothetical protein COCMIDRAFT_108909 [Bipolaris oryzae ATCC 44560]
MAHCDDFHPQPFSIRIESPKGFSHSLPGPVPTTTSRTNLVDTPFPFLSLPRELRDLIYSHTSHERGIHYRDRIKAATQWSTPRRTLASHINLLLTSRQIHTEALSTLLRTQTVEISPGKLHRKRKYSNQLSLSHVLCSFPLAPARLMTRVQVVYDEYSIYLPSKFSYPSPPPSDGELMFLMWEHIVRHAWTLKEHFPHLTRFEAWARMLREKMGCTFCAEQRDCHTLGESEWRQRVNQVAARVVSWLERELGGTELAPPPWLRIILSDEPQPSTSRITFWRAQREVPDESNESFLRFQHEVLEKTHWLLAKKRAFTHEEREASGRIWLEQYGMKRKRGRTGWCEEVGTA